MSASDVARAVRASRSVRVSQVCCLPHGATDFTASILGSDAVGTVVEPSSSPLNGKRVLLHSAVGWLEDESGPDVPSQPFGIVRARSLPGP